MVVEADERERLLTVAYEPGASEAGRPDGAHKFFFRPPSINKLTALAFTLPPPLSRSTLGCPAFSTLEMDDSSSSKSKKRDIERPRITYHTPDRTFDRLFKGACFLRVMRVTFY